MRLSKWLVRSLGACLLALPVYGSASGTTVRPEPLAAGAIPVWNGPQYVQADRAGRVYFLRADRLEVYPLSKSESLKSLSGFRRPRRRRGWCSMRP
jgi:hypothetical protein